LTHQKDGRRNFYQIADPQLPSFMMCLESRFGGQDPATTCVPADFTI
jgi:hypothetical protein